jgi:hypothetical protein
MSLIEINLGAKPKAIPPSALQLELNKIYELHCGAFVKMFNTNGTTFNGRVVKVPGPADAKWEAYRNMRDMHHGLIMGGHSYVWNKNGGMFTGIQQLNPTYGMHIKQVAPDGTIVEDPAPAAPQAFVGPMMLGAIYKTRDGRLYRVDTYTADGKYCKCVRMGLAGNVMEGATKRMFVRATGLYAGGTTVAYAEGLAASMACIASLHAPANAAAQVAVPAAETAETLWEYYVNGGTVRYRSPGATLDAQWAQYPNLYRNHKNLFLNHYIQYNMKRAA